MQTLTDTEIIAKHSPSCRSRARMELAIVSKLIESADAAGYRLEVAEYESEGEHGYDVKTALFDLDEALVVVWSSNGDAAAEELGWIRLVFGNSGYDLVSDYSLSLEAFLAPVLGLADSLE
jgi:hypothetical protein